MSTQATAIAEETASIPAGTWDIDPIHSTIGFEVKHLGISTFRGRFNGYSGSLEASENGLEKVSGEIDAASVDVNDPQLAGHLATEDFFNTEAHPKLRFNSTAVEPAGEGSYRITGDLEIRGVSKPVELEARVDGAGVDPGDNHRISLVAEGVVDRTAYGMTWNSKLANGALTLGEKVRLVLSVEAVRRSA
jgi:polyisoprenoid-binding protein YceI